MDNSQQLRDRLWEKVNKWDVDRPSVKASGGATFGQPTQMSIQAILTEMNMESNAVLVDMGSGTGTILFHAAMLDNPPEKMVGIEFVGDQHNEAVERLRLLKEDNMFSDARASQLANIELYEKNILDLTSQNLEEWALNRPLYIISFDPRFPDNVMAHLILIIAKYARDNNMQKLVWVSTFSSRGLKSKLTPMPDNFPQSIVMSAKMTIGGAGVTESHIPPPIFVVANQEENYTEEEWDQISDKEDKKQLSLLRKFKIDELGPQLEQFVVYSYRFISKRARIEKCVVCERLTDLMCQVTRVAYCGKVCQTIDWYKRF